MKFMKFIDVVDEQGRFVRLKVNPDQNGREASDTFSYLYIRKQYEELAVKRNIGLGERVEENYFLTSQPVER